MQEKNEKISGIMAEDDKGGSKIDSLIKKLMVEIAKESEEDIRKQTIQSTTHRLEHTNEDDHDIDKEITELETLIKRLQAEIVEMSETSNKPLPSLCPGFSVIEENSANYNGASYASPERSNEEEPESVIGVPIISKDDGMLEEQVKMFAENISNIINVSNSKNAQKDALDDVRRNFNVLWDDPTKSSKSNLDLTEKPTETLSSKLSIETDKSMCINNIKSISNNVQIEQSDNVSELCKGANPNDEDTRTNAKKISADNKLPGGSTENDDISGSVNEAVADNIMINVPILLNAKSPYNLPGNIESHSSTNTTVPKDAITGLPKSETLEAAKTTFIKTLQNVTSSDSACSPKPSQVIPVATPTDTPEMIQSQSVTRENAIPKTDSIFTSFNKKIRKIVGRGSEKSISKENHKSEELTDKDLSKEFQKAFPRSKSEPSKNFYTSDDDSSVIDPKNIIALTQDSPKNVIKGVSDTININESETSISETNNIKAAENSNEIIPSYNLIIDNTDKSKSVTENASDTTITTASLPTESDPSKNFIQANVLIIDNTNKSKSVTESASDTTTTTASLSTESDPSKNFIQANVTTKVYKEMPINIPNGQTVNIENITDTPTPDLSRKNPEEVPDSSASIVSSISSAIPKLFGSNFQTGGQQENGMKVNTAEVEVVQENTVKEDVEADEDEDDDVDDEKDDYEDDDENTYDVD